MEKQIVGVTVGCLLFSALAYAVGLTPAEMQPPAHGQPRIDVVFVLDTTGSMGGLIEGAKQRIWSIANTMATAKPVPRIRMGLIGYRDRGDDYVTRSTPLTDDLDRVYADLMAFSAGGGGDSPESVNQALHEAVVQPAWDMSGSTYRVIFLVGDCPPHMDYQDDVKYGESCRLAAERGIIINTIQCGTMSDTEPIWREIARKAEGRYFHVEQSGGAFVPSTPYDTELSELSRELEGTRLYYGSYEIRKAQRARGKVAKEISDAAPAAASADRAVFNVTSAGKANFLGAQELINDLAEGVVKLADLTDTELPDELKKMTTQQREEFVADQAARRAKLQQRIEVMAQQRARHIRSQAEATGDRARDGFDQAMIDCVREQTAKKGIEIGPE